jgi:hypothetical protein
MKEHEISAEKCDQFTKLNDLPANGYWIGNMYRGPYWNSIAADVEKLESVCRTLYLPPIQIRGTNDQPELSEYPDMAGHGLASLKRAKHSAERKTYQTSSTPYIQIQTSSEFNGAGSIGWNILVNGQMIDRMYAMGDKQIFLDCFESGIKKAIVQIVGSELLLKRSSGHSQNMNIGLYTVFANLSHTIDLFETSLKDTVNDMITHHLKTSLRQLGSDILGRGVSALVQSKLGCKPKYDSNLSQQTLSENLWRNENFPERYKTERHGPPYGTRIIGCAVPYAALFGRIAAAIYTTSTSNDLFQIQTGN